jgi:hypothetical protein
VWDLASHAAFELFVRSPAEVAEEHGSIARHKLDSFVESELPPAEYPRNTALWEAAAQIVEVARAEPLADEQLFPRFEPARWAPSSFN